MSALFFLIIQRPPRATLTDTLLPYTTLFRSRGEAPVPGLSLGRGIDPKHPAPRLEPLCPGLRSGRHQRHRVAGRRIVARLALNSRSEEHKSELQSLMRISYAVFCLKTKIKRNNEYTM